MGNTDQRKDVRRTPEIPEKGKERRSCLHANYIIIMIQFK
jgi:hypothetical protein